MIDMYQIISKYLAGESSETENRELEAWRRLNEENERIFQELSESWVLANGSSFSPCYPDKEKIWNKKYTLRNVVNYVIFPKSRDDIYSNFYLFI